MRPGAPLRRHPAKAHGRHACLGLPQRRLGREVGEQQAVAAELAVVLRLAKVAAVSPVLAARQLHHAQTERDARGGHLRAVTNCRDVGPGGAGEAERNARGGTCEW
eukprot:54443-Chlamydomonas_euryale.AAC.1